MSEYVPEMKSSKPAGMKDELSKKEQLQQKHYFLLSELQKFARDVPG